MTVCTQELNGLEVDPHMKNLQQGCTVEVLSFLNYTWHESLAKIEANIYNLHVEPS